MGIVFYDTSSLLTPYQHLSIYMEELKITITKESNITREEFAKFLKNFNLLKSGKIKGEIIELVKSLVEAEKK